MGYFMYRSYAKPLSTCTCPKDAYSSLTFIPGLFRVPSKDFPVISRQNKGVLPMITFAVEYHRIPAVLWGVVTLDPWRMFIYEQGDKPSL